MKLKIEYIYLRKNIIIKWHLNFRRIFKNNILFLNNTMIIIIYLTNHSYVN